MAARDDVIVLGAGLSGLYAAWLLSREGVKVQVIEARQRVGGRIESFRDVIGNPEMGGDSILAGYGRLISAAAEVGVKLVDDSPRRSRSRPELALGGRHGHRVVGELPAERRAAVTAIAPPLPEQHHRRHQGEEQHDRRTQHEGQCTGEYERRQRRAQRHPGSI